MDDHALRRRLDGIRTRQHVIILLLVVPYLVGGAAFLMDSLGGVAIPVLVVLALVFLLVGLFTADYRSPR